MCYNGKCMCLQVETGALIWAILCTFFTGLETISSITMVVFFSVQIKDLAPSTDGLGPALAGLSGVIAIAGMSLVIMEFAFSVLLLVGVIKRHGGYVKAYFVYGVMKTVMALMFIVIACGIALGQADDPIFLAPVSLVVFVSFGIYGLILHMIRMTYYKFNGVPVKNQDYQMMS